MRGRVLRLLNGRLSPHHIAQLHAQLFTQDLRRDNTIISRFIVACETLALFDIAFLLFRQLPTPHIYVSNTLIQVFSHSPFPHYSRPVFDQTRRNGVLLNNFTFTFILKSLARLGDLNGGQAIHAHIAKTAYLHDLYVGNSLLGLYSACGRMVSCRRVFDEIRERDIVSWTTLITGYRTSGMHADALTAFEKMRSAAILPNRVTIVTVLPICAEVQAVELGIQMHDFIRNEKWDVDVLLGTSLIDMYSKCGMTDEALRVFRSMKKINVFTWNALIKGFAVGNRGVHAVQWFLRMEEEGFMADEVTLLNVLSACNSDSGMVGVARQVFGRIILGKYPFSATAKHYSCVINLLARAGYLEEAFRFTASMPFPPLKTTWGALMTAARAQGKLQMSVFAAKNLLKMEPGNPAYHVLLSNLFAEMRKWQDVEDVREQMKYTRLNKDLGCSSVTPEFEKSHAYLTQM